MCWPSSPSGKVHGGKAARKGYTPSPSSSALAPPSGELKTLPRSLKISETRGRTMSNALHSFRDILSSKGLIPSEIIADGELHRCPTKPNRTSRTARISPTWMHRQHFGGAIGKLSTKVRSPRPRKTLFPRRKKRYCGSAKPS